MSSPHRQKRPTSEEAAARLVILKHIIVFAGVAMPAELLRKHSANWTDEERHDFSKKSEERSQHFWQRLKDTGLLEQLSPRERHLTTKSILTLAPQEQADATWRTEAAQVLLWALDRLPELPPYDELADREVIKRIPSTVAAGEPWALRAEAEIDRAREVAEMWHWRSRTRTLIERGDDLLGNPLAEKLQRAGFRQYDDIVRACAKHAADKGAIGPCIDEDFPVQGKAYRDLDDKEWSRVRSITMERHFALNWLCGLAPGNRWDETPTDT